jgi:predicted PurR-regulated permease PerM
MEIVEETEQREEHAEPVVAPASEKEIVVSEPAQSSDLALFLKRARAIVPVAVGGTFLLGVIAFLYFAKAFMMPIVLAILLAILLKPIVAAMAKIHIPESIAALLVIVVFFTIVSVVVSGLVQPAAEWANKAPETVERVREKFQQWFRRAEPLSRAAASVQDMTQSAAGASNAPKVEVKQPAIFLSSMITFTTSFAAGLIETVVLLFFMLAAGDLFMNKLVKVLPTLHDKKAAVEIARDVQHNLSTFLFTITVINAVLGALVGCSAFLLGLPNPVLWGVLAGLLNFIPYFGPITGCLVLLCVGFITFDSPWRALAPTGVYLILHAVESNVVTPMVLGRRLTLNPLVIFVSLMFWTWLWGISGALLSIPLVMMLKVFCDHFKPLHAMGEFLSGGEQATNAH